MYLGPTLPETCVFNESSDPAKLTNRQRGHLAEIVFMRKAASLGLAVAKPCNEGERYDFIARVENVCWRIQVKSVANKSRHHYRIKTSSGGGTREHLPYSASEIDFLVAYLHPEDLWYVFPAVVIVGQKSVCVKPGCQRSRYEQYREAWKLMDPEGAPSLPSVFGEVGWVF